MHKCVNNSTANLYHLEQFVSDFFPYSQKQLGFDKPVTIKFESDDDNASTLLGKTAYYDPDNLEVTLFVDGRHPKDVMRSLSHELVHHAQNCRGDFGGESEAVPGYAQSDPHLRKMEREAYTKGNLIFRDFEDLIKTGKIEVHIDFKNSGEPKMSLQEWKNNEINQKLMKKWGLLKETKKDPHAAELGLNPEKPEPGEKGYEELNEDSKEEESEHYGKDESADKREEDRLEHHLDAIEHHLGALRDDMHFDQHREDDHMDEGMDHTEHGEGCGCPDLEEGAMGRGDHYKGIGKKDSVNMKGFDYSNLKNVKAEVLDRKISVKEAKVLTRRILEHIQKGDK
jgi:hypothetical protein